MATIDVDETELTSDLRPLRGYRKRWRPSRAASSNASGPSVNDAQNMDQNLFSPGSSPGRHDEPCDESAVPFDWEPLDQFDDAAFQDPFSGFDLLLQGSGVTTKLQDAVPRVLDPQKREPSWKLAAIEADVKRSRRNLEKLPWELEGSAFKPADKWQGTFLASFDKRFAPTSIGISDVWHSQVVQARASGSFSTPDLPVAPISLKQARREPLDEDIRCRALLRFRDIILQDPLATQLGTSLRGRLQHGDLHDEVDQSFRDTFRMKASSTLQKRAASLHKLAKHLKGLGQLNPLRVSEPQLYAALCNMRASGAGATSAQHVIESLHFLDATAKFTAIDINETISARCRGVARDMYLTKNPLRQKKPLTVEQVSKLENAMVTVGSVFRCIIGQILFCIHSCCRWKDAQRLKSIEVETGHGEALLYGDALASKIAVSAEARTRFLPYAAIGTGVSGVDWSQLWVDARHQEGLVFGDFVLPSFSEKRGCWLDLPMSASEATAWLRDFLDGTHGFQPELIGSHSCKTTLLTWAGRCIKVQFSHAERRLLGHHLDPSMKSVLCYSRESFTSLYSKVLCMFRLIRAGSYCPDLSAIDRVVQMAEGPDEAQPESVAETQGEAIHSDSDSSIASLESVGGAAHDREDTREPCLSLFPSFPGVPETDLMVHNTSGLVHVVNEDDIMLCGRPTSSNFKAYVRVVEREHLASCRQCLRSFQNRKA